MLEGMRRRASRSVCPSSARRAALALLGVSLAALPALARAQATTRSDSIDDDPLSIGGTEDLDALPHRTDHPPPPVAHPAPPANAALHGPVPPHIPPKSGQVLTAIPGVYEAEHRVTVHLGHGLARVDVEMGFASRARVPAEVRYQLAVPPEATLGALEVCTGTACRRGLRDLGGRVLSAYDDAVRARGPAGAPPIAEAHAIHDARGDAIEVRAAPVRPHGTLTVRLRWVAPAPMHGGVVRLRLPARGTDPRAAPATVTASANSLLAPSVDDAPADRDTPAVLDPWVPAAVAARAATASAPSVTAWRFPCGAHTCARVRVSAGPRLGRPVDLILLVDASPSTEGPARGRIGVALAALLASAPDGSTVQALAFAGRARPLIERPIDVADAPLVPLAQATSLELGSATRFEAAWETARPWVQHASSDREARPVVMVVIGDGGLTHTTAADRAFAQAAREGVQVSVLNVADRATWRPLAQGALETDGVVVDAGGEADRAVRGRGTGPLEERVASIFAPVLVPDVRVWDGPRRVSLGPLRAGEERVWQGEVRGHVRVRGRDLEGVTHAAPEELAAALGVGTAASLGLRDPRPRLEAVDPADLEAAPPPEDAPRRCEPRGPPHRASGVSSDRAPVALAVARTCTAPVPPPPPADHTGHGMPAISVLRMLRERVMPVARLCFRRDRAGRPSYHVRAEIDLQLADREVVSADVHGSDLRSSLRQCLLGAVDTLEVPPFAGTVVVTYPLRTEDAPQPPVIQLRPDIAQDVDQAVGPPAHTPAPAP